MNRRGEKPDTLEGTRAVVSEIGYQTGHGDVTRFDKKKKRPNPTHGNNRRRPNNPNPKQ
jgi:hypothetical protein